jgi:hypothetical protein
MDRASFEKLSLFDQAEHLLGSLGSGLKLPLSVAAVSADRLTWCEDGVLRCADGVLIDDSIRVVKDDSLPGYVVTYESRSGVVEIAAEHCAASALVEAFTAAFRERLRKAVEDLVEPPPPPSEPST